MIVPTDKQLIPTEQPIGTPQRSDSVLSGLNWFDDRAAAMGLCITAGKGSGKSTLIGKELVFHNWLKGFGQILLDPLGGSIDQLLDRLIRYGQQLSPKARKQLWQRVRFVDMGGAYGTVTPWPLYYRLENESCYQVAQRYLEIVRRIDPNITNAPIQGWNPLHELASQSGIVLSSLDGFQVPDIETMLRGIRNKNATWKHHLAVASERYPHEVPEAVAFLQNEYAKMSGAERRRVYGSLHTKLRLFAEPTFKAMFGSSQPGIDWTQVIEDGILVLIDFRHVVTADQRQFLMLMVFLNFIDFIRRRGPGKHHKKVGFVVDELTTLTNQDLQGDSDIFSSDLDDLINVLARNNGVMVTLALQEAWQVSERILNSLRSCGNLIQGVSSHPDSALDVAKSLFPYDPRYIRRKQPVYAGDPPEVIDFNVTYFSPPEWYASMSQAIQKLKTFRFLVRGAQREGDFTGSIKPMSIEHLIPIVAVDAEKVAWVRRKLALRDGIPIEDIFQEIETRRQPIQPRGTVTAKRDVSTAKDSATVVQNETVQPGANQSQDSDQPESKVDERDFFN
ncbi:MAG: hypothetical protein AAF629_19650 [Chloroflexota bacterium]